MKLNRIRLACAALALMLNGAMLHAAEFDSSRFDRTVSQGMNIWQVPGLAVAVIEDGDVVFMRGYGHTAEGGTAVDEHTLFSNASTTKAMIAAGVLMLADDGELSIDDPVIDYLPELHLHGTLQTQQITIRDLLAHRTGLPSTDFWTFRQLLPLDEQIRKLRLVEPAAAVRTRKIYQNTMYELAGIIIGRVAGKPWYEFLDERLWEPLGMHNTVGVRSHIPPDHPHVLPHDEVDGEVIAVPFDLPVDREDAAGSAWSSVHDMSRWAQFLLRGGITEDGQRLLSEDSIAAMFEPSQLVSEDDYYPTFELTNPNWRSYGLGWYQQDFQGRKIDFHTGSLDGLVAIFGLDRASDRAVIVFQNMDGSELRHALLWDVMDQSGDRRDWVQEVTALYQERADEREQRWQEIATGRVENSDTSLSLDAYLGEYQSEILGTIRFVQDGNKLILRTGMYDYSATHWHFDTFLIDYITWSYGSFVRFGIDPDGKVSAMTVFGEEFEKVVADD